MSTRAVCALLLALPIAACFGSETPDADGSWVGTITTVGSVTTVVNESGSVWGGTATLVEEASIGVEAGEPQYMLAGVVSIAADDQHIYVLQRRPPLLRVYDMVGKHVRDIGGEGQGPGEFTRPQSISVTADGRLLVRDDANSRMSVFSGNGELLDTWSWSGGFGTITETVIGRSGTIYRPAPVGFSEQTRRSIWGYVSHTATGEEIEKLSPPEFDFEEPRLVSGSSSGTVPFHPRVSATFSTVDAWVAGIGDPYRFEIRYLAGRVTVVERVVDPVPVSAEEREWHTRLATAFRRREDPSWRWNGPPVRDTKPFFVGLTPAANGRVWVNTSKPGRHVEGDCTEDPQPDDERLVRCWDSRTGLDVFDSDGRYLGDVEFPSGEYTNLSFAYIRDDMVVRRVEDEAGTIMVKRYRLVLPGEEEQ